MIDKELFDLPDYHPANPILWQGRSDTLKPERFFQKIQFVKRMDELINTKKKTVFLGFASDAEIFRNQGRPGAQFGSDQIKIQLARLPYYAERSCVDLGNVVCNEDELESAQEQFAQIISFCHQNGHQTFGLGGGHEIALAHYQGLASSYSRLGIINFDAHFDLRPHQAGEPGTSGTPFSQIAACCAEQDIPFEYCCIGIQKLGNTASLFKRAAQLNVSYLTAEEVHQQNLAWQLAFLDAFILQQDHIYLTVCLDVLAECFAPGVSAPQPMGLSPWQILPLLKHIMRSGKVVAVDVAELSPPLDQDQKTARLAALIIAELLP